MNMLVVEDTEDWQDLYRERFAAEGARVTVVDNVDAALRLIRQGDILFDVAIIDKGGSGRWSGDPDIIGHRDGLRVLQLLKEEQPACIRVLATAEPYVRGAFDKVGIHAFYDKRSGSLGDLSSAVVSWHERGLKYTGKPVVFEGPSSSRSKEDLR